MRAAPIPRIAVAIAMFCLVACGEAPREQGEPSNVSTMPSGNVAAGNVAVSAPTPHASPVVTRAKAAVPYQDGPMDDLTEENTPAHVGKEVVSMCWQDYCPCDPPQGGADKGLCRQLRAGMHVDPEIMAAAAMSRDAREELARFERDNP